MQVETLRDVLVWTSTFHDNLADCMERCAVKNENPRARMLLDYLAKHERSLSQTVSGFEHTADNKAINTWCYDYLDKHPILNSTECDAPFSELDDEEIMGVVTDQHEQVIDLYRYLHTKAEIPSTQELMDELESLETQETRQMVQSANRMHEM